jgi:hypothetical protein
MQMLPRSLTRQQSATFMPRFLLLFAASDERQMRPLHSLAKVASRQIEATVVAICRGGSHV